MGGAAETGKGKILKEGRCWGYYLLASGVGSVFVFALLRARALVLISSFLVLSLFLMGLAGSTRELWGAGCLRCAIYLLTRFV